ncbi:MAG: hypothetical protein ABI273_10725 [Lacunisphaera sp.]
MPAITEINVSLEGLSTSTPPLVLDPLAESTLLIERDQQLVSDLLKTENLAVKLSRTEKRTTDKRTSGLDF